MRSRCGVGSRHGSRAGAVPAETEGAQHVLRVAAVGPDPHRATAVRPVRGAQRRSASSGSPDPATLNRAGSVGVHPPAGAAPGASSAADRVSAARSAPIIRRVQVGQRATRRVGYPGEDQQGGPDRGPGRPRRRFPAGHRSSTPNAPGPPHGGKQGGSGFPATCAPDRLRCAARPPMDPLPGNGRARWAAWGPGCRPPRPPRRGSHRRLGQQTATLVRAVALHDGDRMAARSVR